MKYKPLLFLVATLLLSCECPYLEEDRIDSRSYICSNGDVFYAEKLLGTWQCYYPMIIGGMEFKQIKFMSNGKADITMAKQRDTEWYTETYDYAYYGNTLRFSRKGNNISLHGIYYEGNDVSAVPKNKMVKLRKSLVTTSQVTHVSHTIRECR